MREGRCPRRVPRLAVLAAGWLAACGFPAIDHHFTDEGKVCLLPQGANLAAFYSSSTSVTLGADQAAVVTVMMPTCLSSSCSRHAGATCTATLNGSTIEVTSTGSYTQVG